MIIRTSSFPFPLSQNTLLLSKIVVIDLCIDQTIFWHVDLLLENDFSQSVVFRLLIFLSRSISVHLGSQPRGTFFSSKLDTNFLAKHIHPAPSIFEVLEMFHQHLLLDHGSDEGDVQDMQPHPRDTVCTLFDGYLYHIDAFSSALIRSHHSLMAVDEFCWWLTQMRDVADWRYGTLVRTVEKAKI